MKEPTRNKVHLKLILTCAVLVLGAILPATASADSAQLTKAVRVTDTKYGAAFNVTFDSCSSSYCGWFPIVHWVNAGAACPATEPTDNYVVVGSATEVGSQQLDDYFYAPKTTGAINFCVYIYHQSNTRLVTTIPWVGAPNPARLSSRQAISYTKTVLGKKLGKRFKKATSKRISCKKSTTTKQKCSVSFKYKGRKYKGTSKVEKYFASDDLMYSVIYSIRAR